VEQLTNDPVNKYAGFMFQAPDFDDSYIFFTLADHTAIQVFEQTGFNPDGSSVYAGQYDHVSRPQPEDSDVQHPRYRKFSAR
jgi:hypothetical protein